MKTSWKARLHQGVAWGGPVLLLGPLVYLAWFIVSPEADAGFVRLVVRNHLVFFGMPYAAFFAYYAVVTLESSRGPIQVEFGGLKFQGAAGPLIFWILIFLSVISGFKLLWVG
ncbi:hypothetical protein [Variovorax sp. W2I14]|uniref:hypothetical protein n=1 Tax=Variovorax sp. W2I14 TaxID=3042290 RepID=UPI003D1B1098